MTRKGASILTSADLKPSATWARMAAEIARDHAAGQSYREIHQMNIAVNMAAGLEPYRAYRALLDELLWKDDPGPKTIIDLGAGYGAMATCWPEGSTVYNVDLPEMLEIQREYLHSKDFHLPEADHEYSVTFDFIPIDEADRVPFDGAYLFSVWALTETTPETWAYYIDKAPRLAGAYVLGYRGWESWQWPWQELANAFKRPILFRPCEYEANSMELLALNR